ncbi:MAG: MFS transporter [Holosporales bacterium]|jgi:predicted MFS family arabinose efflux permease|nr:MFS transporter [Holosporales bacterium]
MKTKVDYKSWTAWGIANFFYLYELILRVSPSVMTSELMTTFNATSTTLGILVSFYYYSYTFLQLPCGIILDKMGPRNLIGLSALLCILGSVLFASGNNIHIAQAGRFLIGAGSACAFISCLQIAANSFPQKYFAILVGVTNMMGTIGGMTGGFPVAKLANCFGWQNAIYVLASIGIVILVLVFIFIPKNDVRKESKNPSVIRSLSMLIKNRQIILSSLISGFMYLVFSAFAELWIVPFFMTKYKVGNETASFASAVVYVSVAIGSLVLALYARKIRSYVKTIRTAVALIAALFMLLVLSSENLYVAFAIVFGIGFLTGAQVINFTCAQNNSSPELAGMTGALANCIVMSIGAVFQPLLGALLDFFWDGSIGENGLRIYNIDCYKYAILIIPTLLVISYFLSFFLKETMQMEDD